MLTIEKLKEEYIDKVLEQTGLKFSIGTDTKDFKKAERSVNTVTEYINGLLVVTGSSMEYAGDQEIVSVSTELKFLIRVDDDTDKDGAFPSVTEFRRKLSDAFSAVSPTLNVTENGKTYTVVVGYSLPATGERSQRSMLGDSITYSCTIYFAYLNNAINASDVHLTIDGEKVNFLAIGISRRPSVIANLYTGNANGTSAVYAESAGFVIDLTLPAFANTLGGVIADYILGTVDVNLPHYVVLDFGSKHVETTMIFGESSAEGQGIENVRYTISLIPYATEPITGG